MSVMNAKMDILTDVRGIREMLNQATGPIMRGLSGWVKARKVGREGRQGQQHQVVHLQGFFLQGYRGEPSTASPELLDPEAMEGVPCNTRGSLRMPRELHAEGSQCPTEHRKRGSVNCGWPTVQLAGQGLPPTCLSGSRRS